MSTAAPGELIWEDLERRLQAPEPEHGGVWAQLKETTNVSNYVPTQAPEVVHVRQESRRDGPYYMLNNPGAGTYLKLDEKDFYIWSLMDGTRTVKDLVVAYFSAYGSIAFGRVNDLVAQFRGASFLVDRPVDVYAEVDVRSDRNTLGYWVDKLVKAFFHKEFVVSGIDGTLTVLYNRIFWVFFSKPALLIYPFIAATGLGLFLYTVQQGTYPVLSLGGKWYLGLLELLMANIVTIAVRECAHAFATKHYGRKVRRGGVMMFFGNPAVFVDTMDIWMEPKKSRIAVSWAGPYSGLLLGSLAIFAIAATGFADTTANELIFKLALWAFVFGALTNLNPLLEWDGYFMLMDWLELPMLRKRSMDFVRRDLLSKISSRSPFNREERIFAVFGVMAITYTVVMVGFMLFLWQGRASGALDKIRDLGGWLPWLLIGLAVLIIGVPIALVLVALGYKLVYGTCSWVYRHYLVGRPANQVVALGTCAYVIALPALLLGADSSEVYTAVAGGMVLAIGTLLAIRLAPWYLRSQLQWFFLALPWIMVILLVAQALGPFQDSRN